MPGEVAARFDLDTLIDLTPWAVAGRYPEDIENPGTVETTRLVETAATILSQAAEEIGQH